MVAAAATAAAAALAASIAVNMSAPGALPGAPDGWASLTTWAYSQFSAAAAPGSAAQYPFVKRVELFTATGGCYLGYPGCTDGRDLLVDPADPSKGYDFSPLVAALRNIVASGFTPHIITGNVPIALSSNVTIGAFGFNSQPPANYSAYSDYMAGLAQAAVDALGVDVVRTFWWGVLTEMNNYDWYVGPEPAFYALYDWTACGLESVLGTGNAWIGTHACTQCDNFPHAQRHRRRQRAPVDNGDGGEPQWDPRDFLNHVASGVNYCTGKVGSPLRYFSNSFYETSAERPGDLSWFLPNMLPLQQRAAEVGLTGLVYGVDEGRLLFGPAWEGGGAVPILTRSVGDAYQSSWDALFYKLMAYNGMSYYSRWGVNTDGGAGLWTYNTTGVDTAATNLARLTHRMAGNTLLPVVNVSSAAAGVGGGAPPAIVDAVATLNTSASPLMLQVLVLHHHPWLNWTTPASVTVTACGYVWGSTAPPASLTGRQWLVDDDHANFWPTWWNDRATYNLTQYNSGWSQYGESIGFNNGTQAAFFQSRRPAYEALAALEEEPATAAVDGNGCIAYSVTLQPHAVQLSEWALA